MLLRPNRNFKPRVPAWRSRPALTPLLVVFVTLTPAPAVAERTGGSPPDTVYVAPPIVVSAERPRADGTGRTGFVTRLELGARRNRVEDLADVLAQTVGVRVKSYGGLGSFATVSIRGSSAGQVAVYLDGIPLATASSGVTNLADLPLGGIEHIDVYRGFSPPQLGSAAIGGAVNLVTAGRRRKGTTISARSSYGSFGTSRHRVSLSTSAANLSVFAHGGYQTSNGDFAFPDDRGTPFNADDDRVIDRRNNAFDSWNVLGRVAIDWTGVGSASVTHNAFDREQGVPGLGSYQSRTARARSRRHLSYLKLDARPLFGRTVRLSGSGFYATTRDGFVDTEGAITLQPQDTDNTITSYGGLGRGEWFAPVLPITAEFVVDSRKEQFHPVSRITPNTSGGGPVAGPDRWRRSNTVALTGSAYLFDQTVVVSASQRWERHTSEFYDPPFALGLPPSPQGRITTTARTPSAGARWRASDHVTFKANVGRYYRVPTFTELFGNTGSVTGSAELTPEEGVNHDVGVVITARRIGPLSDVFCEATYLHNDVDDLILFFPNSQRTSRPVNIGAARIRGVELSAAAEIGGETRVSGSYAWLDATDTSAIPYYRGNRLPSRPRHAADLSASTRWGRCEFTQEFHFLGANYLDRANMQRAPSRTLFSSMVTIDMPLAGLAVSIEGRNLTDERVSDVGGFPLPGRALYGTVSYEP